MSTTPPASNSQAKVVTAPTGPPPDANQALVKTMALVVSVLAVSLSLYQLWTAGLYALPAIVQRSIHLGAILALTFLLRPAFPGARKDKFNFWFVSDVCLAILAFCCTFYISYNLNAIFERQGEWLPEDFWVGLVGVILVLEACRRVIGNVMTGICLMAMLYAFVGHGDFVPDILAHKGLNFERMITTLWFTTEGVFGVPIYVAATFVFIFVLFGAFLESTGGGQFFIDIAYALTGRFSGGPAKTSVIASGFMGSVSGSAVGNVVATGSFTIPMMKKVGYRPHVAGAIEAAASTGGQLMPPIMGAGAFLMAEYTQTSYLEIIRVALIPAILYYMTVLLFVHFEAKKHGLVGLPKEALPKLGQTFVGGLHFLIPVALLVTALVMNYSPMMSGFVAVIAIFLTSLMANAIKTVYRNNSLPVDSSERVGAVKFAGFELKELLKALEKGARNAIMVSVACGAAGIIVGMVGLTGMGQKLASLVLELSFGIKVLAILLIGAASLVLGMGLPVTASYIVLASLAGPALLDMGVPLIVTHMIVFWYSQDANVTPPVSLASFAAAGVAGANPMRTAFTSWKLAKGLYIIPIVMAYRPLLGIGENYELWHWEVVMTMLTSALGLLAFAAALERFFIRKATWLETFMLVLASAAMFWPAITIGGTSISTWILDVVGLALLATVVLLQIIYRPQKLAPPSMEAGPSAA
jgi:TRAP transporter 4TM/12TM fusion protein